MTPSPSRSTTAERRVFNDDGTEATAAQRVVILAERTRQRDAQRDAAVDADIAARQERREREEQERAAARDALTAADGTAAGKRVRLW